MPRNPRLFRLTATVALVALLWDTMLPLAAVAQPAPPPLPAPGQGRPDLSQGDPPERVGRIAGMTGTVSFHNLGDTEWTATTLNYPVSSGDAFWTEPQSEAQLEIAASRIAMAPQTEFDVSTLDPTGLQAVAAQGEIYLHLRDLSPNEVWAVQTPRGLVRMGGDGRYAIVVGTTDQPTVVTVVDGAAQIDGPGVSLQVAAGQTATITGTDSFQGGVGPAVHDPFLNARLQAERPPPPPPAAFPTQVVAMPGGSDLLATGTWSQAPDYGQVWYPPVSNNWVPYREGHWAYVQPWGWTWVDDAPWGFAPFHYGRWVQIGGRWAWTPGEAAVAQPPVFAPALVTFIGIGAGVALGAGLAAGSIGWVPLGPREPFHPWYHASPRYVRQVNVTHVTNITNNVRINNYINRNAATAVPAGAMIGSRPVQSAARPVTAQEFAAAHPFSGQQPLRPSAATAGITPVVARQLNLPPAAAIRPAPGPAVQPRPGGVRGFVRPNLTPAGNNIPPRPGGPTSAGPGAHPPEMTAPEPGHPAGVPPVTPRTEPGSVGRPEGIRPTTPAIPGQGHPVGAPTTPIPEPGKLVGPQGVRPVNPAAPEQGHVGPPGALHPEQPGITRQEAPRPAIGQAPEPGHPAGTPPVPTRPGQPGRPPGAMPPEPGHQPQPPAATASLPAQLNARPELPPRALQPAHPAPQPPPRPMPQPEARPAAAPPSMPHPIAMPPPSMPHPVAVPPPSMPHPIAAPPPSMPHPIAAPPPSMPHPIAAPPPSMPRPAAPPPRPEPPHPAPAQHAEPPHPAQPPPKDHKP